MDDTYYYGIRIKNNQTTEEKNDEKTQIDLTKTREKFFKLLLSLIFNEEKSDSMYAESLHNRDIDIEVLYVERSKLPDKVRPTESLRES